MRQEIRQITETEWVCPKGHRNLTTTKDLLKAWFWDRTWRRTPCATCRDQSPNARDFKAYSYTLSEVEVKKIEMTKTEFKRYLNTFTGVIFTVFCPNNVVKPIDDGKGRPIKDKVVIVD